MIAGYIEELKSELETCILERIRQLLSYTGVPSQLTFLKGALARLGCNMATGCMVNGRL